MATSFATALVNPEAMDDQMEFGADAGNNAQDVDIDFDFDAAAEFTEDANMGEGEDKGTLGKDSVMMDDQNQGGDQGITFDDAGFGGDGLKNVGGVSQPPNDDSMLNPTSELGAASSLPDATFQQLTDDLDNLDQQATASANQELAGTSVANPAFPSDPDQLVDDEAEQQTTLEGGRGMDEPLFFDEEELIDDEEEAEERASENNQSAQADPGKAEGAVSQGGDRLEPPGISSAKSDGLGGGHEDEELFQQQQGGGDHFGDGNPVFERDPGASHATSNQGANDTRNQSRAESPDQGSYDSEEDNRPVKGGSKTRAEQSKTGQSASGGRKGFSHDILVHYQENEMWLFPPKFGDESQMYLLDDESLVQQTLSSALQSCRIVLGDSVPEHEELQISFPQLGLIFSEAAEETASLTVNDVLDIYLSLQLNDGIDKPGPLKMILYNRVKASYRIEALYDAVARGQGLASLGISSSEQIFDNPFDGDHGLDFGEIQNGKFEADVADLGKGNGNASKSGVIPEIKGAEQGGTDAQAQRDRATTPVQNANHLNVEDDDILDFRSPERVARSSQQTQRTPSKLAESAGVDDANNGEEDEENGAADEQEDDYAEKADVSNLENEGAQEGADDNEENSEDEITYGEELDNEAATSKQGGTDAANAGTDSPGTLKRGRDEGAEALEELTQSPKRAKPE